MPRLNKIQYFGGHILLMSALLEQVAFLATQEKHIPVVIEQLKSQRLVLDELISSGIDVNPERIHDILIEGQRKLAAASK
jgi:hypothetical protein